MLSYFVAMRYVSHIIKAHAPFVQALLDVRQYAISITDASSSFSAQFLIKIKNLCHIFNQILASFRVIHGTILHDDLIRDILMVVSGQLAQEEPFSASIAYPLQLFKRQANTILHSDLVTHAAFLPQDCDGLHFDPVLYNACGMTSHRRWRSLNASPCSDPAIPPEN
jgi:hypothetical protein